MNLNLNYYSILGVTFESTEKEIKKTYYKLSMEHHPDRGGDAKIFAQINEAYTVLTESREEYEKCELLLFKKEESIYLIFESFVNNVNLCSLLLFIKEPPPVIFIFCKNWLVTNIIVYDEASVFMLYIVWLLFINVDEISPISSALLIVIVSPTDT